MKQFKKDHPRMSYDDIMMIFCFIRKYGIEIIDEFNNKLDVEINGEDSKYKKARKKIEEISML